MKEDVRFIFEIGALKKTKRSGWETINAKGESVADHSFRTAVIGYMIAKGEGERKIADVLLLSLFHDVHETRIGDLNRMNKRYVDVKKEKAIGDVLKGLSFEKDVMRVLSAKGKVRDIVHDADRLDMIAEAKMLHDLGNRYAWKWIENSSKELKTKTGKKLCNKIIKTDSKKWLFEN
jgi:putative hydrolase of HD superfamily